MEKIEIDDLPLLVEELLEEEKLLLSDEDYKKIFNEELERLKAEHLKYANSKEGYINYGKVVCYKTHIKNTKDIVYTYTSYNDDFIV